MNNFFNYSEYRKQLNLQRRILEGLLVIFLFALSFFLIGWIPANMEKIKAKMEHFDKMADKCADKMLWK